MVDITNKAAQEALQSRRYFSLSYDIPTTLNDLAELIRSRIRSFALAVHESGYLVPEANVQQDGWYKVWVTGYAFQSDKPITSWIRRNPI